MFLNASIIYEELSKTLNVSMSGYSGKNEHLRFPLYFTPGTMLREDRVYVCDSAELSADTRFPSRCCIVSSDPITAGSHTDNCTFITVNEPMDKAALFNHVQQVFEKYSQWEQELNALVHNNSGIHDILKHSQTLYEGIFFLIVDVNYRVLATTSPPDYFAFISDETGSTPQSVLARFKKDPEYIRKRFDRKTYLYNGIYFDHGILTHHIFINDELSGTFTMTEHGTPITDGKWAIFEHLCAIVDKFYQSRFNLMYRDATRPSAIFQHILSGHTVNESDLKSSLQNVGWDINDRYLSCFVEISEQDKKIMSIPYLCQQLEGLLISAISIEHETDIVVILNTSKIDSLELISKQGFRTFLEEFSLQAGISNSFRDMRQLKTYHMQAVAALEIGHKTHPNRFLYHFSDYLLPYLFKNMTGDISAKSICPEGLLTLHESDNRKNSEYIKTLSTYFSNGLNASQAARALHINRSTFLERMRKIKDTLELDIDNYDTQLYLMLCLKILEE